jgi:hypothetical protein
MTENLYLLTTLMRTAASRYRAGWHLLAVLLLLILSSQAVHAQTATVASVTRLTPSPAATAQVSYQVVFSSSMSGISISNFNTTTTGSVSGTFVSSTVGSGTTYTVTVRTGTGDGTLRLNVVNGGSLSPSVSNAPYTSGEVYTITKTFAAQPQLTIVGTGGLGSDVTAFVDAVQVLSGGLAFANGLQNGSFEKHDPLVNGNYGYIPTGASWTFNAQSGIAEVGSAFTPVTPIPNGIAVAFIQSTGRGNGQLQQNLALPTGSNYQVSFQAAQRVCCTSRDQALNVFLNGVYLGTVQPVDGNGYSTFTSATFAVTVPPLTANISSTAGTSGSATSTSPIPFTVTFSQPVTDFTASDVMVSGGGAPSGFTGSGSGPYSFTVVPSGPGNTVLVSLAAGVAVDANNTPNSASNVYNLTYQVPITATPVLNTPADGATTTGAPVFTGTAPASSTVTLYLMPSGGTAQSLGTTTATGGSFSLTSATALSSGSYSVYATAQASGSTVSTNSATNTFTVDATPPTVLSINRQSPTVNFTNATTLTYRITFSEAVSGVSANDFSLSSSGTATGTTSAVTVVSTSVYDVTVTSARGDGTLRLDLNNSGTGIADLASNSLPGGYTNGQPYVFDNTPPEVTISTTAPNPTSSSPISFTVTFGESVTGFTASDITVTNGTITTALTSAGATYSFSVTPSANGAVMVSVASNAAQDAVGNGNTPSAIYSLTYAAPSTLTTWKGSVSTDWFTAGNWSASVPTASVDAIIPASTPFMPNISNGIASTKALTLNAGATLKQGGGTLNINANLTNNGTFTSTSGTVALGANTLSSILGSSNTSFYNLTVGANGAQLSTSASTSVQRVLTLNGSLTINGNPFTLESNASNTAMIVNNGSNVVSGNITVQRYIVPDLNPGLGYRHVSSPISSATVASLTTPSFTPVVNPAYNTSATPSFVRPFPTVYGYDQSRLATATSNLSPFEQGWYSPATTSAPLTVGQGYTVMTTANQTWSFTGTQNNGNISQTLTRNSGATAADAGLQLVGNPYPSPLDWSLVTAADRPNVDGTIYVWTSNDPSNRYAGNYGFYNSSANIGTVSPVLPLGQAFFVRVAPGQTVGTLTLRNSHRLFSYNNSTYHRTAAETRPVVHLALQGVGSPVVDDAFVYFENGASATYDAQYDAEKLVNPSGLNLSTSLSATQRLCIDGRPVLNTAQLVVPLAVGVPAAGSYTLKAAELLNLSTTPTYLRDLQTGAVIDLAQQLSYQFTVSNASALITGRFELLFSPQQPLATAPAALVQQVGLYPNPAKASVFVELPASLGRQAVTATLVDAVGRVVRTLTLPAQGAVAHPLDLRELPTGIYALRLRTSAGTVVKKLTVE